MTSLQMICGLGPPPPIKNPGYAYAVQGIIFHRMSYASIQIARIHIVASSLV